MERIGKSETNLLHHIFNYQLCPVRFASARQHKQLKPNVLLECNQICGAGSNMREALPQSESLDYPGFSPKN